MTFQSDLLERLATESTRVKEVIVEGRQLYKDLGVRMREARELIRTSVRDEVEKAVARELGEMEKVIIGRNDEYAQALGRRLDQLVGIVQGDRGDLDKLEATIRRLYPPRCPGCGEKVDHYSALDDPTAVPKDGDLTMCDACGEVAAFVDGGIHTRLATGAELTKFLAVPEAKEAWIKVNKRRNER